MSPMDIVEGVPVKPVSENDVPIKITHGWSIYTKRPINDHPTHVDQPSSGLPDSHYSQLQWEDAPNNRRYIVEGTGIEGGMSTVYKGWDRKFERLVAVKVANFDTSGLPQDEVYYAHIEAMVMAKLSPACPYIVEVYDFVNNKDNKPITIMEYLDPSKYSILQDMVDNKHKFKVQDVITIVQQLKEAYDAIHAKGLSYHDLKLGNVFYDEVNKITKLSDFGLEPINKDRPDDLRFGTLSTAPPEMIHGGRLDEVAEVYSLATVTYELLTGKLPLHWDPENTHKFTDGYGNDPQDEKDLAEKFDHTTAMALKELFMKGMSVERKNRIQTIHEYSDELISILQNCKRRSILSKVQQLFKR
ncbi:serine/threonine protein kinase [Candidatus Roizmanbacteria bacterium]|nr:serine/threonine protein kinase [Candidatus Roizmanbacteria bacterium]